MCTLIILYKVLEDYPIIALHNRYAQKESVEYPPQRLVMKYTVFCPIELQVKGTWIGFNEKGLFLAVTDQHSGEQKNWIKSRGVLLLNILANITRSREAKDVIIKELSHGGYKKGNFVILDPHEGYHILYDEKVYVRELKHGFHVFTNVTPIPNVKTPPDILDRANKRRRRAEELAREIVTRVAQGEIITIEELLDILKKVAQDHAYGKSELSICYHGKDTWTMTSSTIMAVGKNIEESRILYCPGNPCENKFIDYTYLVKRKGGPEVELKSSKLSGKKIAICLTGSVATILAPLLARELRRHGAEVHCYMTKYAIEYGISPKVMEWATRHEVITELTGRSEHLIDYDLVVVYPASLNTINKIANGIADNAVTTLCAATPPNRLLIAPAMNLKLYFNHELQRNLIKLRKRGVTIIEPRLEEGSAKIARVNEVVDYTIRLLSSSKLKGKNILILTGPTRYAIDAVRYIVNRASGRIGYWLAKEAFQRGCNVKVIYGPGNVEFPHYIPVIKVETTEDYLKATLNELMCKIYDYVIFSAAILDYKPDKIIKEKVKSGMSEWIIRLVPTIKVIKEVRSAFPKMNIVAFKLEYNVSREVLLERARKLMDDVNAMVVIANDITKIRGNYHEAIIIDNRGGVHEFKGTKAELSMTIFDILERLS
ncbi:MAG: bifunctional phosphopantothenoylcysteine decarboxylase/phosphopantothenate--cysteine ligase CoaBC [Thermoprotei archaeon]|nr:MAG: bifunctional phosphopantothenoylcysteine decarboxylase/phosphopantothenate--cysteine ligase CoaBC [Thermoprotei archaeon]